MHYNYVRECVRNTLHTGIDYVIPSHPLIGAVSAGVGYYTRQWTLTYSQAPLVKTLQGQFQQILTTAFSYTPAFIEEFLNLKGWASSIGNVCGYIIAPLFVPDASSYLSERFHLGSALATSLILNIIAQQFFGIKIKKEGKNIDQLIQSLKDLGVDIPLSLPPKSILEPHPSPFKDIVFPGELNKITKNTPSPPTVSKKAPHLETLELKNSLKSPPKISSTKKKSDLFDDNNDCICLNLCF